MINIEKVIKRTNDCYNAAYDLGYKQGYSTGVTDGKILGIERAEKLINDENSKNISKKD